MLPEFKQLERRYNILKESDGSNYLHQGLDEFDKEWIDELMENIQKNYT